MAGYGGYRLSKTACRTAATPGERWQSLATRREEAVRRIKALGPGAADTPDRVQQYNEREAAKSLAFMRAGVTESFFTERRIGPTLDLDDSPPNEPARLAGVPVGRIVELDASGKARTGFATGFLIAPNILLTNHHVFTTASECDNCGVQFGYEKIAGALAEGPTFALAPSGIFFTDDQLDFTIVGVATRSIEGNVALSTFGSLRLIPTVGKILVGQPISIIQYPEGGPKKYGVRDNELLLGPTELDLFLQYSTDTLPGSSGSPAFNKDWEVVALHHSGVPEIRNGQIMTITGTPWSRGMPDTDIHWVANEGARVSRICAALRIARVDAAAQPALQSLVSTFHEDFTPLPAADGTQGNSLVTAPLPLPTIAPGVDGYGISITVNGSATFQFGETRAVPPVVTTTPPAIVAVEKALVFDPDYDTREGYDRDFLGVRVSVPKIASARAKEILLTGSKPMVLKYHHYSLVMNRVRKLQMWSAVNVDFTAAKRRKNRGDFGVDTWVADPRIPGVLQIQGPELYDRAKKFDRGHIVRREDTAWGDTEQEEIFANSDSFHWTNCTPQHEDFNRAAFGFTGLWGGLENHIQSQVKNVGNEMSIFAGPILDNTNDILHDFGAGEVLVPTRFWKVLFVVEKAAGEPARLRAYGFVLDQQDAIAEFGIEKFSAGKFKTFQVRLEDISTESGVVFAAAQRKADALATSPVEARRVAIETLDDVVL
jgi:endonuclease G